MKVNETPNKNEESDFIHLHQEHIREYPDLVFGDEYIHTTNGDQYETDLSSGESEHTESDRVYRPIFARNDQAARQIIEEREAEEKKKKYKNVQCVNCGERGHVVKDCDAPITSFGIIAIKTVNEYGNYMEERYDKNPILENILRNISKIETKCPKVKFLMIQRKDTMGYIDFVRGKYPDNDTNAKEKLIQVCLNEMTAAEKENLLSNDFDTIWDNLWVNHESKCYKNEKALAKLKFERLDIKSLVARSETKYKFQEFSFPKGRKNMRENNIACAEREFFEETGYRKDHYNFIKNYPTIHEEFTGTNDVCYRHIYYLVKMKDNIPPPRIDHNNILQTGEVQNLGWFNFEECMALIRPYDTAKKNALEKVYKDILAMKDNYECSHYYHRGKNHWNSFDNTRNDYRSFVFKSRSL